VAWLIASGRDLGDLDWKGKLRSKEYSALEIAQNSGSMAMAALLEGYMTNPVKTAMKFGGSWRLRSLP